MAARDPCTNVMKDYLLDLLKEPRKRAELAALTGMSDRAVRMAIKELTRAGSFIIHDSKTNTYRLTADVAEMDAYLKFIDSYQTSAYFTYLPMRKAVAEANGQRITKVREHFRRLGMEVDERQERMEGI